jgi:hypothetical protein
MKQRFLLLSALCLFGFTNIFAERISVPRQYNSIQAAIDASKTGDTIFVSNGVYNEQVIINKSISLIGESRDSVLILPAVSSACIEYSAQINCSSDILIASVTIGGYFRTFCEGGDGLQIIGAQNIKITDAKIYGGKGTDAYCALSLQTPAKSGGNAIYLSDSRNVSVDNSDVLGGVKGFYLPEDPRCSSNYTDKNYAVKAVNYSSITLSNIRIFHPTAHDASSSITLNNATAVEKSKENPQNAPSQLTLKQNFPNPFNPVTQIDFFLSANGKVKLRIFDLLGREVVCLLNREIEAGEHSVVWDASGYPSGVYFCRLEDGMSIQTKKLTLMK